MFKGCNDPQQIFENILDWHHRVNIPPDQINFIKTFVKGKEEEFKVLYDIGSSCLHWHKELIKILPNSDIYCFEGASHMEPFYQAMGISYNKYFFGILGKEEKTELIQVEKFLGLVNLYHENIEYSKVPESRFTYEERKVFTLKNAVESKNMPLPDFIKMDVQGSELDIVQGSVDIIKHAKAVILELPHVEYNIGAPEKHKSIEFMEEIGFINHGEICSNGFDGDFFFTNKNKI